MSTNGITDASPAGAYAKVAYRGWYNDFEVADDGADPNVCDDIAEQLVRRAPGNNLTVIMAGGNIKTMEHKERRQSCKMIMLE